MGCQNSGEASKPARASSQPPPGRVASRPASQVRISGFRQWNRRPKADSSLALRVVGPRRNNLFPGDILHRPAESKVGAKHHWTAMFGVHRGRVEATHLGDLSAYRQIRNLPVPAHRERVRAEPSSPRHRGDRRWGLRGSRRGDRARSFVEFGGDERREQDGSYLGGERRGCGGSRRTAGKKGGGVSTGAVSWAGRPPPRRGA